MRTTLELQVQRLGLVLETVEAELEDAEGEDLQRLTVARLQLTAARDELRLVCANRPPDGPGERPPGP